MKKCIKCESFLTGDNFTKNNAYKDKLDTICKKCKSSTWKSQYRKTTRGTRFKTRYGITESKYDEMLKSQGFKCAICNAPEDLNEKRMHVDHCHATGKVRGILCFRCNTGLGNFQDNSSNMIQAMSYLACSLIEPESKEVLFNKPHWYERLEGTD